MACLLQKRIESKLLSTSCRKSMKSTISSTRRASTIFHCKNRGTLWLRVPRKVYKSSQICRHTSLKRNGSEDRMRGLKTLKTCLWNSASAIKQSSTKKGVSSLFLNSHNMHGLIIWRTKVKNSGPCACGNVMSTKTLKSITGIELEKSITIHKHSKKIWTWSLTINWLIARSHYLIRTRKFITITCLIWVRKWSWDVVQGSELRRSMKLTRNAKKQFLTKSETTGSRAESSNVSNTSTKWMISRTQARKLR